MNASSEASAVPRAAAATVAAAYGGFFCSYCGTLYDLQDDGYTGACSQCGSRARVKAPPAQTVRVEPTELLRTLKQTRRRELAARKKKQAVDAARGGEGGDTGGGAEAARTTAVAVAAAAADARGAAAAVTAGEAEEEEGERGARADADAVADTQQQMISTSGEQCPKCGHDKLSFRTVQLRSVDEGQTILYTCTRCRHRFAVNS